MKIYSPNMLKTYEECPKKFFFKYIERVSLPQRSTIFDKGKKIHALANYYLNGFDIAKMEKTLNEDEKKTWESLKSNKYFKLDVVNTEYNLSCKVADYWVGGRLDALMKVKKLEIESSSNLQHFNPSTYIILDYKTGQIPKNAQYDFQTIIYLLCADKHFRKNGGYESLKFVYLGLKNSEEKEITLTESLKKEYEEKISYTCEQIEKSNTFSRLEESTETCRQCAFNKLCQFL